VQNLHDRDKHLTRDIRIDINVVLECQERAPRKDLLDEVRDLFLFVLPRLGRLRQERRACLLTQLVGRVDGRLGLDLLEGHVAHEDADVFLGDFVFVREVVPR